MVAEGWSSSAGPQLSGEATVTLLEGMAFCISSRAGDIYPGAQQGLFFRDTRFISRWLLLVNGQAVEPLNVYSDAPYSATFVGRQPPSAGRADSTVLVVRRRYVGQGMEEQITLRNLDDRRIEVGLALVMDSDFAGLFEVKEGRAQPRPSRRHLDRGRLELEWTDTDHADHGTRSRGLIVEATGAANLDLDAVQWHLTLEGRQTATVFVTVCPVMDGEVTNPTTPSPRGTPADVPQAVCRRGERAPRGLIPPMNACEASSAQAARIWAPCASGIQPDRSEWLWRRGRHGS